MSGALYLGGVMTVNLVNVWVGLGWVICPVRDCVSCCKLPASGQIS